MKKPRPLKVKLLKRLRALARSKYWVEYDREDNSYKVKCIDRPHNISVGVYPDKERAIRRCWWKRLEVIESELYNLRPKNLKKVVY